MPTTDAAEEKLFILKQVAASHASARNSEGSIKAFLAALRLKAKSPITLEIAKIAASIGPHQILVDMLSTRAELGVSFSDIHAIIRKTAEIRDHRFLVTECDAILALDLDPEVAYEISKLWYKDAHFDRVKLLLGRFLDQGSGDLKLYYAFTCKETRDYDEALRLAEQLATDKTVDEDITCRATLMWSELLLSTMRASEATEKLRPLLEHPVHGNKASALMYSYVHYSENFSNSDAKFAAENWEATLPVTRSISRRAKPQTAETSSRSPIKVGLISKSFRTHPVGWMIAGLLVEARNYMPLEFHVFDLKQFSDFVAKTIQEVSGDHYYDLSTANEHQIVTRLHSSDLDILIDLDGHQPDNIMHIYRNLNGPRLLKWIGGLVNSTYLSYFDGLISDWHQTPQGTESNFSEVLYRLPDGYVSYTPPPYKIEIEAPPVISTGHITFGSTNNVIKLNRKTFRVWAQILNAVPGSRLLLKDRGFDISTNRDLVVHWLNEESIDVGRIDFIGRSDHQEQLGTHNKIDICLDPIPYSGGLCTLEALSMGTPVISLAGEVIAHRHSVSHLTNTQLTELIAYSEDEYINKAIELSESVDLILQYSKTLREKLIMSPLLNHKKFLLDFEKIMRGTLVSPS